jgi:epoxyqueuosine reductase QueG
MNDILEQIKGLFAGHQVPVFGMARSSHLENAAPGYKPSDLLASAKSMLCMGVPVPKGVFQCRERTNETYWRAANIYYRNMDAILLQVARLLEEKGETAVPVFG